MFDRFVNEREVKIKNWKETVKTLSKKITKKNRPRKSWVDQGSEIAGDFLNFCSAKGIENYPTMSETKAAFAERTIRSLKNFFNRYMADYGYKYVHKLPQFIATMNSSNNQSIDMKPNHVKDTDFMSIFYNKLLREYKNPNMEFEMKFAFPGMIYPEAKFINHNIHRNFLNLLPLLLKNVQSKTNKTKLYVGNVTRRK